MNIIQGDSLEKLKELKDNSVDAVVTDPPYGLSFMGKKWDYDVPSTELWQEVYRVLKPGGHLLAFAGTRTQHRMAVNIEDAGFEIRDMIAWVYGSGFPKSLDVSKAIDKAAGAERVERVDWRWAKRYPNGPKGNTGAGAAFDGTGMGRRDELATTSDPATDAARQWNGWGTALKPALEPITVARKPIKGSVADNVLKWGTGGINIDGCRVELKDGDEKTKGGMTGNKSGRVGYMVKDENSTFVSKVDDTTGRFPANLIHDGSDEVVGLFPDSKSGAGKANTYEKDGGHWGQGKQIRNADFGDSGSASRFFYCAKASKTERNKGLEGFEKKEPPASARSKPAEGRQNALGEPRANHHPTVKPIKLMQYLVRLVTPKGGTVLDPFMGSGTTGIACKLEEFDFIGIEREEEYIKIAKVRIKNYK